MVYAADNWQVLDLRHPLVKSPENLANATYIVKCVNEHEARVAICKAAQALCDCLGTEARNDLWIYQEALEKAIAALAVTIPPVYFL